ANHHLDELRIASLLGEELAAQAWPGREVEAGQYAVGVHIPHSFVHVVTRWAHLVEVVRIASPVLGRPSLDGVEPEGGDLDALDEPRVGAVRPAHHPGHAILECRWDVIAVEARHGWWFDDVVVDADQNLVFDAHVLRPFLCVRRPVSASVPSKVNSTISVLDING